MSLLLSTLLTVGCATLPEPELPCATITGTPTPGAYTRCGAEEDGTGLTLSFSELPGCSGCSTTIEIDDPEGATGLGCDEPGYRITVKDDGWPKMDYAVLADGEESICSLVTTDLDFIDELTPWEGRLYADTDLMEWGVWGHARGIERASITLESVGE